MKKFIGLISFILMVSCTCLSQIPPQTIYVNNDCEAILPDFTQLEGLEANDNCEGLQILQNPLPGTVLTFLTPTVDVELVAVDAFGNTSETVIVPVVLADSIAPTLIWQGGNLAFSEKSIPYLWNNILAHTDEAIAHFMYDRTWTQGYEFADTIGYNECGTPIIANVEEGLKWMTYNHKLTDEQYAIYVAYKESQE